MRGVKTAAIMCGVRIRWQQVRGAELPTYSWPAVDGALNSLTSLHPSPKSDMHLSTCTSLHQSCLARGAARHAAELHEALHEVLHGSAYGDC